MVKLILCNIDQALTAFKQGRVHAEVNQGMRLRRNKHGGVKKGAINLRGFRCLFTSNVQRVDREEFKLWGIRFMKKRQQQVKFRKYQVLNIRLNAIGDRDI